MAFCPSCGSQVVEGAKFCATCGKPLSLQAASPPQPAPQPVQQPPPVYQPPPQQAYAPPAAQYPGQAPPPGYPAYPQPYPPPAYPQPYYGPMPGQKSAGIALVLSLLITGLGQIYNGEVTKGVLLLVVIIVLWIVGFLFIIPFLGVLVVWIYGMYDAYTRAEEYNRVLRATGRPPW